MIEPSSAQSIVQTAGRVNRHRLAATVQPNIAVLQFKFKHAADLSSKVCFTRPGLEVAGQPYVDHDLATLFDWRELERCGQVDARARFNTDSHAFAAYDDVSTEFQIGRYSDRFLASYRSFWMGQDTYKNVPLLPNGWLAWSFEDLRAEALRLGLSPIEAFAVELDRRKDRPDVYSHSLGPASFLAT